MSAISSLCRTCMVDVVNNTEEDVYSCNIFETEGLAEKLMLCSNIEIQPYDEYPPHVCNTCCINILDFYGFKEMCRESLEKFNKMLENQTETGDDASVVVPKVGLTNVVDVESESDHEMMVHHSNDKQKDTAEDLIGINSDMNEQAGNDPLAERKERVIVETISIAHRETIEQQINFEHDYSQSRQYAVSRPVVGDSDKVPDEHGNDIDDVTDCEDDRGSVMKMSCSVDEDPLYLNPISTDLHMLEHVSPNDDDKSKDGYSETEIEYDSIEDINYGADILKDMPVIEEKKVASNKIIRLVVAFKKLKDLMDLSDEEEHMERRFWVNPFLEKRQKRRLEAHLLKDLLWKSSEFQNFCQMNLNDFEQILSLVDPKIKKQDTSMRDAISPSVRLAVTLRFIATGEPYRSLEFISGISRKTISKFVPEVLEAIIECLQNEYLKLPSTASEWKSIAHGFQTRWQFPHTLGAVDGKHIRIKAPPHSGSDFYNNKGLCSIALFGVVDCNSRFIYVNVGGNGCASDVDIFKNSSLYEGLRNGSLNIPPAEPLPGQTDKTSYYLIGDDIFGLDKFMMKSYNRNLKLTTSQEIFNYRLSRSRMPVEMAFGRLADRFRIFHRPLEVQLKTCDLLVKACCILHNYLTKPCNYDSNPDVVTGCSNYEDELIPPPLPDTFLNLPQQTHKTLRCVNVIRDNVAKYLVADGDVPFQWEKTKKQE